MDANHKPNDIEAFEPWSAIAFEAIVERTFQKNSNDKDNSAASSVFSL